MSGQRDEGPARRDPDRSAGKAGAGAERDEPVLPPLSRDESDVGWGDEPGSRDEDWYRRERPPHHE